MRLNSPNKKFTWKFVSFRIEKYMGSNLLRGYNEILFPFRCYNILPTKKNISESLFVSF